MNTALSVTAPEIQAVLRECALNASAGLAEAVRTYLALLLKWNQRANLTGLDRPAALLKTLFAESFYAATLLEPTDGPVLDVGSGAGFPGMAMHLYRPELPMILLEPRKKRAAFLAAVRRELGLSAVTVWSRRLWRSPKCDHHAGVGWSGWTHSSGLAIIGETSQDLVVP
jgi:16S rRNA G527 N7-methylase RsmG